MRGEHKKQNYNKRKKRNRFRGFIWGIYVLLFVVGLSAGKSYVMNKHVNDIENPDANAFLEGITGIFSSEPSAIQELREKEVAMSEEGHLEYYFKQLNEQEQRAYRQILEGVRKREPEFYLTIADEVQLDRAYHAVLKDHPEIFWIHNRKEVYRTTYGDSAYCLFSPGYTYTPEECAQIQEAMNQAYDDILWLLTDEAGEYEKAKVVYTYLIDETEYQESEHDQSIAGVFWKKNAVCAGYAGAMQYLLERLGVECIYVDGEVRGRTDGHAWNIIKIEGEYYYADATNGDQPEFLKGDAAMLAEHKTTIMDYLCPFPEEYEQNYFCSEEFELPECTSRDMNFYVRNQGCFSFYDRQTLYDYCCMRMDNNAAVVRFKFSDQEAFDTACREWIEEGAVQDAAKYYMKIHNLYEVEYHYGVLEDLKSVYFIF